MRPLTRFLSAALLAASLAAPAMAHAAPKASMAQLNLQMSDLPAGFAVTSNVTRNAAQDATYEHSSLSLLRSLGFVQLNMETFTRTEAFGLYKVDSRIEEYQSAADAHGRFERMIHHILGVPQHYQRLSTAKMGDETALFSLTVTDGSLSGIIYEFTMRQGVYAIYVDGFGLIHAFGVREVSFLCQLIVNRIRQHG